MMKVLVINTVRFKLNGISAVIKNYYQAMDKKNLQMDFIAIDEPSAEYVCFFEENNLRCFVYHKKNIISYFYKMMKLCRKEKYDIVHIHGNSANMAIELLAVALGGVKIRVAHSHNTATMHPLMHKVLWPIFSKLCTTRLACGEDAGKWLYRDKSFIVLNNGIQTKNYSFSAKKRNTIRKELALQEDEILLGHVGNFIEQKNHSFLIDIFSEIHSVNQKSKLLLISDGMLMPIIKEKVHSLGLDDAVIFLGKTLKVSEYLQGMDLFLLPSLHEGLPVVLVEAQAAGLISVVSDRVAKEADLTKTSVYLPIDSVTPWTKVIEELEYTERDREESSKKNIVLIKEKGYDIEQNADKLRQIYVNACEER
ncbi:MAG: glycosyltransferase family 1 protein [Clostridium sp.]|nr:glycosyltransferase family 1 protein [Clostridium sp.]